jgi:hypothetical protein
VPGIDGVQTDGERQSFGHVVLSTEREQVKAALPENGARSRL